MSLRHGAFPGSILLVGDEPDFPYERPPLSKEYLAGEKELTRILWRPAEFWAKREVQLRRSTRMQFQ